MGDKGAKRARKEPQEFAVLLVERYPLALRREVKSVAARQGKTLREAMIEAAQMWLKREGGRNGKAKFYRDGLQ